MSVLYHFNLIVRLCRFVFDFRKNYFIDATFINDDPLLIHVSPSVDSFIFILYGSLSDLSDTPILLSQLIQQEENLNYDEDRKLLRIKQLDSSWLKFQDKLGRLVNPDRKWLRHIAWDSTSK